MNTQPHYDVGCDVSNLGFIMLCPYWKINLETIIAKQSTCGKNSFVLSSTTYAKVWFYSNRNTYVYILL